ncbi:hypothetical protein [Falsiroseomonas sp.]|uniref:hypothetical protein n=1 Tax=Falsiroseomonas sp. TaxID=2870721 RepID=UPI003F705509
MKPPLSQPEPLQDADLTPVVGGAGVQVAAYDLDGDGVPDTMPQGYEPPEDTEIPPGAPPLGPAGGVSIG